MVVLDGDKPLDLSCTAYQAGDFTVFIDAKEFRRSIKQARRRLTNGEPNVNDTDPIDTKKNFDFQHPMRVNGAEHTGRLHAALCFGGSHFSVTLRSLKPDGQAKLAPAYHEADKLDLCDGRYQLMAEPKGERMGAPPFLASVRAVGKLLYKAIFDQEPEGGGAGFREASGLVLLTGGTGSGKTTYLNALAYYYLKNLIAKGPDRRPHVVAIGDPVETFLFAKGGKQKTSLGDIVRFQINAEPWRPADFTARTLGVDVDSVRDAMEDALRETPKLLVVSELRKNDDFAATLDFAATGHLVFATSHNTSLVDAMGKLMRISRADTPSSRATLAQRLKAVVHIRTIVPRAGAEPYKLTLPALWRSNSSGVRNFVSDGLSSILCRAPLDTDNSPEGQRHDRKTAGALGYFWSGQRLKMDVPEVEQPLFEPFLREALNLDLNVR